jgi:hypothetical protein
MRPMDIPALLVGHMGQMEMIAVLVPDTLMMKQQVYKSGHQNMVAHYKFFNRQSQKNGIYDFFIIVK